ncbi:MAG: hypothetical protein WHX52_18280 [Anaerolineae bacterium]
MSEMCEQLHRILNKASRFRFPFDEYRLPQNGIYVMFEFGEQGHNVDRIVHIGTHTGKRNLRSRLEEHLTPNKDRSVLRKNIGRAILSKNCDPFLEQWNWDLTTVAARERYGSLVDLDKQGAIEDQVTDYIQKRFSFAVFGVDSLVACSQFKWRMISTVSLCDECGPSVEWLGLHSPKAKIRQSGLWLEKGLYKEPLSQADLETLIAKLLTSQE